MNRRTLILSAAAAAAIQPGADALAQAKKEITISRQPGILYMPSHIIQKQGLLEKHAKALGFPDLKIKWVQLSGGGNQTDAMLAGSVDVVNTGTGNLLLLWDRTRGKVKGICATSALPLILISRLERIKSLQDFKPGDKIAVPTVKVSTQAILLQMASAKMFGEDKWDHFDPYTVQLGHPDAFAVMSNPNAEVTSHFAAPPFQYRELKSVPGAHVVIGSPEIIGGPLSQAQFFTTTAFADANPVVIKAIRAATAEALAYIHEHTKEAVEIYRETTGDTMTLADLLDMLAQPGMMEFNLQPQGTMKFAAHLHKVGTLKTLPTSWKDYYLPVIADLDGS